MMMMSNRKMVLTTVLGLILVLVISSLAWAQEEMPAGQYMTLVDENNQVVLQTGSRVYVDDEYIAADNSRYKVTEVSGSTAHCVYQGKEKMPEVGFDSKKNAWVFNDEAVPVFNSKKPTIALYHTHSDESYVPNDGKESINGRGGIYDVGDALNKRLKELGFNVIYSQNNHNPHDINAYNRSRRTAFSLLRHKPDAIIDVHRDAVPAGQYQTNVKGQEVTKVKLVVGRQNPNMKTNLDFAKRIKAVMDKKDPGLSNGIFMGKGSYNQDLNPRAMLIEVGSDTNKKPEAEKGVMLFANSLPVVLGVSTAADNSNGKTATGPAAAKPLTGESQNAGITILVILVVVAAAIGGYYLLNRRSTND